MNKIKEYLAKPLLGGIIALIWEYQYFKDYVWIIYLFIFLYGVLLVFGANILINLIWRDKE